MVESRIQASSSTTFVYAIGKKRTAQVKSVKKPLKIYQATLK